MGDHGAQAPPGGSLLPNGLLPSSAAAGVGRALGDVGRWARAEERIAELIARIQPSGPSEERRNAVSNYVQRLIMKCFSCRVFTFGSVPLKTYLPDGDIDLTAFSENDKLKDTWANEVRDALENEEKNENAEFRVKEVQYIQAEVKIIKCLVEDIVVDISFNQVGGLCTLCFLDEIDSLINQNHLFKQSIILIKAWCYYESRILGAHHGLISTYALETLVLYIFNVYNNSFAGPLEVLYRFLEFFSNFDWEKFCVSLWGPVPISSLPDMTAEAPRKDDGELLLNKLFLDICSALYSVFPAGQENQGQPFVSKYLNIVDPLRINNNLGRSVSKGNFFRIRSAFTFGARRLARLLECPEGHLIAEVNQFFTNTWARHDSGNCPDAPSPNLWHLRPSKCASDEDSNNSKGTSTFKKKSDSNALLVGHEYEVDGHLSFHGPTPKVLRTKNQQFQRIFRTSISPAVYHDQNQKSYGSQINSNVSDYIENAITSRVSAHTHNNEKHLRPDHFVNEQEGQDSFQFTSTHSSPELAVTDISAEALVRGNCNKVPEAGRNQNVRKLDHDGRIKNFDFDDPSLSRDYMPDQILESTDSHGASNSYHDSEEQIALVSETLEMYQKGQDLVNMMTSSRASNVNEQVQLPRYLPSHVPLPLSSALIDSVGYNHKNLGRIVPSCIPMTDPSWGSNMQNPQSSMPSHLSHYSPTSGQNMESEDTVGSVYGGSSMTDMNLDDDEQGFWYEDEAGSQRSNPDNGGFQKLHSQGKKQPTQGESNVFSSSRACNSGDFVIRGHNKFAREHKGSVRRDDIGAFEYQTSRGNDIHSTVRNGNIGPFPVSKAVYPGSKPASECSVDGSDKPPKSTRDRRGRKLSTSMILTALYGKSRSRLQPGGSSNHTSSQTDDEASTHDRNHELPGRELAEVNELAEVSGSNSLVPLAPMHVSAPHKRVLENSVVAPYEFYPTGPPVPFLAMLPVYNNTHRSGRSPVQFDSNERVDHGHTSLSGKKVDSAESLSQSEVHMSSSALRNATPEPPEEHKSDILNSDFSSHWQNLQYGRSCQNTRHLGPVIYPSPVVMPPVYIQGHFPWGGPGRPLSANLDTSSQIMSYGPPVVPVSPLQPSPGTSVLQRLGDEGSRYHGGTGTYLPNRKVSPRDHLSSSTRNHICNYNHDQNDHDREESWNTSKLRAAGRNHGRNSTEKTTSRPDRSSANDNRANRRWTSHRHESRDLYQIAQTSSSVSTNSSDRSLNMVHGMYPQTAVNSNGMNSSRPAHPSAVKLYSYGQGVPYSSHSEPSDYGSLRLLNLSGGDEIARSSDEKPAREDYQHRHGAYEGSSRSSPD